MAVVKSRTLLCVSRGLYIVFFFTKNHFTCGRCLTYGESSTCISYYAYERKKIEKKYLKAKNKYTKKGDFDVRYITSEDFRYQPVEPYDNKEENESTTEKEQKGKKKKKGKKQ